MGTVTFRKVDVDGIKVFYREAGPKDAPTILLLHGFPTAGHMFRDLMPHLADRLRLVARDLRALLHTTHMHADPRFDFTTRPAHTPPPPHQQNITTRAHPHPSWGK